jgi:two-component system, cell cycle sensor histidine kinase PleC
VAQFSPLQQAESRGAEAPAGLDWDIRLLVVGAPICPALRSKASGLAHGLEIAHTDSLAGAFADEPIDAVLIPFEGSVEAERRLERLPAWLSAAIVAVVGQDCEEVAHQALKCGADEVISGSADISSIAVIVRRALARKSARDCAIKHQACATGAPLTLVQETAEGLVILDHDGAVRFANDVAEDLLGAAPGSLTGKPFRFPVSAGEPITADFPEGRSTELRFIETEWGGIPARIGSLADVTVRRELEKTVDALEELQSRMADRDREFVSELSATIRRPLTNIVGFSELMLARVFGPIGDERYSIYLRDIRDSGLAVVGVLQALEPDRPTAMLNGASQPSSRELAHG